jgi:hypothetical protein
VTLRELGENVAQGKFNELAEKDDGKYQRVDVSTAKRGMNMGFASCQTDCAKLYDHSYE